MATIFQRGGIIPFSEGTTPWFPQLVRNPDHTMETSLRWVTAVSSVITALCFLAVLITAGVVVASIPKHTYKAHRVVGDFVQQGFRGISEGIAAVSCEQSGGTPKQKHKSTSPAVVDIVYASSE